MMTHQNLKSQKVLVTVLSHYCFCFLYLHVYVILNHVFDYIIDLFTIISVREVWQKLLVGHSALLVKLKKIVTVSVYSKKLKQDNQTG